MSKNAIKEQILHLLATNDKAVARALVLLTARQTYDEREQETTRHSNMRGFRPCHARVGTNMAKFFQRNGYLTEKQIAYWRKPMKNAPMKIGIYWAQLAEEIEAKRLRQLAEKTAEHPVYAG